MKCFKKISILLLTLVLLVGFMPGSIFAATKVITNGTSAPPTTCKKAESSVSDMKNARAAVAAASEAVEKAVYSCQGDDVETANQLLNDAQVLVTDLSKNAVKTVLQNKLNDNYIIITAVAAVVKAKNSRLETDVANAQLLVTELQHGAKKRALQAEIDAIVVITSPAPTAVTLTPENGATNVDYQAAVIVVFDSDVSIVDSSGITIDGYVRGRSNAIATLNDDKRTLTIAHDDFDESGVYTVIIPAGAVENSDHVPNAEITWNFTVNLH